MCSVDNPKIDMVSPSDVRIVHSIETDDPEGIEKYWHARFAERRVQTKEVFRLTPDDIAAGDVPTAVETQRRLG